LKFLIYQNGNKKDPSSIRNQGHRGVGGRREIRTHYLRFMRPVLVPGLSFPPFGDRYVHTVSLLLQNNTLTISTLRVVP